MQRLYQELLSADAEELELDEEASHHLSVVRVRRGQTLIISDGRGLDREAEIVEPPQRRQRARVALGARLEAMAPTGLRLGVAMAKGERYERLIEKAAELGVDQFLPVLSERSLGPERAQRGSRWSKMAREASALAERSYAMEVEAPASLMELLRHPAGVMFHQGAPQWRPTRGMKTLLIGPEGGFSPTEVEQAHQAGWSIAGLGPRNLRVETAAVTALALALWAHEMEERSH